MLVLGTVGSFNGQTWMWLTGQILGSCLTPALLGSGGETNVITPGVTGSFADFTTNHP